MNISSMVGLLGFIGALIGGYAYVPQINHLIQEKCSAGLSPKAYRLWCLSSAFILINALYIRSAVFILLGVIQFSSSIAILLLSENSKGHVCESHLRGIDPLS